jgi:hypothetical protein
MQACIFFSSILVLVNGSPTKDFKVENDLPHVDPLAPLMAAEGLAGLVRKVLEQDMFKSYKISNELEFNIL